MARINIVIGLTALCVALVTTVSLVRYFSWTTGEYLISHHKTHANPSNGGAKGSQSALVDGSSYLIGAGKADITGPVAEIEFMGYADPDQLGSGVRQRLYTRAFIVGHPKKPEDRIVYLVQDIQSGDTAVRDGIIEGVKQLGPEYAVYGQQNIAVTGTHSHSGPGAWLNYLLPQIPSKGFNRQSYEAIVQGSVKAIQNAHQTLQAGTIHYGSIKVPGANINRSPFAYLANPEEERDQYDEMVDTDLTLLRLQAASDGKDIGVLTWFPTHGTSMHNNNTLVTGDNKGVAAHLFEKFAESSRTASTHFVAGFSQANVGDTSPNVLGAYCENGPQIGQLCDYKTSLCAGKANPCHARGSHWGLNDGGTSSTYENGRRQYAAARKLYESMLAEPERYETVSTEQGPVVKSVHVFVDFAHREFALPNGTMVSTCPAALGYSFAAGTSDGPGNKDFKQHNHGDPDANPFWEVVRNRIHKPGPEQIACQGVKPILLDVGETLKPYLWTPNIVDIQFFRVGQFFMIVSPGEATTMAGRRWRQLVKSIAQTSILPSSAPEPHVVLGGPANSYTHYITTPAEYDIQRYEGASTLYGQHTLDGYLDLTSRFLPYLSHRSISSSSDLPLSHPDLAPLDPGPSPPIHTNISWTFITPVLRDSPGLFKSFGQTLTDVSPVYTLSRTSPPVIAAEFVAANPRNNLRHGSTFALLEKWDEHTARWTHFRDDGDWSLVFEWTRSSTALGTSKARVKWETEWEIDAWGRRPAASAAAADPGKTELRSVQHGKRRRQTKEDPLGFEGQKVRGFEGDYTSFEGLRGRYRLRYFGDAKSFSGAIEGFEGISGEFEIV